MTQQRKAFKHSQFYVYEGNPASWGEQEFPVLSRNGKEEVLYDIETFFREAQPISEAEHQKLVQDAAAPSA